MQVSVARHQATVGPTVSVALAGAQVEATVQHLLPGRPGPSPSLNPSPNRHHNHKVVPCCLCSSGMRCFQTATTHNVSVLDIRHAMHVQAEHATYVSDFLSRTRDRRGLSSSNLHSVYAVTTVPQRPSNLPQPVANSLFAPAATAECAFSSNIWSHLHIFLLLWPRFLTCGDLCAVLCCASYALAGHGARNNFYSHDAFLRAAATFPAFAKSSDATTNKRELAAFLAHIAHKTGGLCWIVEGGCFHRSHPLSACLGSFALLAAAPCLPG